MQRDLTRILVICALALGAWSFSVYFVDLIHTPSMVEMQFQVAKLVAAHMIIMWTCFVAVSVVGIGQAARIHMRTRRGIHGQFTRMDVVGHCCMSLAMLCACLIVAGMVYTR